MKALKIGIATLVVATVALAVGVGVMASSSGESRGAVAESKNVVDPGRRAELIRSRALNERYGLGEFARWPFTIKDPELRALMIRSDALNRKYKLGRYAPGS